jgi:hypothetical protein
MSPETRAMTDAELADAHARHDAYKRSHDHVGAFACCTAHASADDVPRLLAEVKRLQASEAEMRTTVAGLTADGNWVDRDTELEQLRAQLAEPLSDEYGLRITFVSTLTEERAIADTLAGALDVLDAFDARDRRNVVSRELMQRPVGKWRKAEQEADHG